MSTVRSIYPVLAVSDPAEAAAFFTIHFEFVETFAAHWYVSLRRDAHELAFVSHDHPTIPAGFGTAVSGVLLNIEVDDATAEYARLVTDAGLPCRLDLRDESFGQRHFIVEGPDRILVDVIEEIAPSADFASAFSG
ncbi:VOC family protein [Marisediminicola sp. LYQ134]|uniref:VOC family protein n=1 Tax=Marisediminicola sp. LYQ134 TaxID=3391061 RepID=UPI00398339FD